jgi:hypothetical protein
MTDDDDWDVEPPDMQRGHAETRDDDDGPFRGWLYVPDLSSTTRWTAYEIRRPRDPEPRRIVGFRR